MTAHHSASAHDGPATPSPALLAAVGAVPTAFAIANSDGHLVALNAPFSIDLGTPVGQTAGIRLDADDSSVTAATGQTIKVSLDPLEGGGGWAVTPVKVGPPPTPEIDYSALFAFHPDGVAVLGEDGTVLAANAALTTLAPEWTAEYVGTSARVWMEELEDPDLMRLASATAANGTVGRTVVRWPGSVYEFSVLPRFSADGSPDGRFCIVRDITEADATRTQLETSEARHAAMVSKGSDLVALVDPDLRVTYMSPAAERLYGVTVSGPDFPDANDVFVIHPDEFEESTLFWASAAQTPGGTVTDRRRIRVADGSYRHIALTYTNLFHVPAVNAIVVNAHDVTEMMETFEQLERARDQLETAVEDLSETRQMLATALVQMNRVREDEKRRLSQWLHDSGSQPLFSAIWSAQMLWDGAEFNSAAHETLLSSLEKVQEEFRAQLFRLYPAALTELGLPDALTELAERAGLGLVREGAQVEVCLSVHVPHRLLPELEELAFRTVQEGVVNANKHADASQVKVDVTVDDGPEPELVVSCVDNGHGFGDSADQSFGWWEKGFGLRSLEAQAASLGGSCVWGDADEGGAVLTVRAPAIPAVA